MIDYLNIEKCSECGEYICEEVWGTVTNIHDEEVHLCKTCYARMQKILNKEMRETDFYYMDGKLPVRITGVFRTRLNNILDEVIESYAFLIKDEISELEGIELLARVQDECPRGTWNALSGINTRTILHYNKKLNSTKGFNVKEMNNILTIIKCYYDGNLKNK
jgi:hypothetical protein